MSPRAPLAVVALLVALSATALGEEPARAAAQVPMDRQALVMLRVLAYDRNLHQRASGTLTVAVVSGQQPEGVEARQAMTKALQQIARESKVLGLPVRAVEVEYSDAEALEARLKAVGASAVYVCPGMNEDEVRTVSGTATRLKLLSFSGDEAQLGLGVGVAFVRRSVRVAIVINRPAVKEAGVEFAPEFLQVAEVRGE